MGNKTILLVDDDAWMSDAISTLLSDEGYKTLSAKHGQEALEHLRSMPRPDLILLDLMMPVMDGRAFLAEQRKDPELAKIPVIIMSASDQLDRLTDLEVAGRLAKSLDVDILLNAIEAIFEGKAGS